MKSHAEYLSEQAHIRGLKQWVKDFKIARKHSLTLAREIRDNINSVIVEQGLNPDEIYGSDPDRPSE